MRAGALRGAAWLALLLAPLAACARYEAIPWREAPGHAASPASLGERLSGALERQVREEAQRLGRLRRGEGPARKEGAPLRVVVAAFPEAGAGVRTRFSEQIERSLREALARSSAFEVLVGGESVAWQEAIVGSLAAPPEASKGGVIGGLPEGAEGGSAAGGRSREAELDGDHPLRGLWPQARGGRYGEDSAVFSASIFDADAAVFGAYALGPERVRVWAAVVLSAPPRTIYYVRGLEDIFGLPERMESGRIYLAHARDALPRGAAPQPALASWVPARPRARPRQPPLWGEAAFEVVLERIDHMGVRSRLAGGEALDARSVVVGRVAARSPRYVYGFAVDRTGSAEEVLASPEERGRPARVEPGRFAQFTARLLPSGRSYRLYFVSSGASFAGREVVEAARRRLGVGRGAGAGAARGFQDAADGAPTAPWFVPPGQERLILAEGFDQEVFWFFRRQEEEAPKSSPAGRRF